MKTCEEMQIRFIIYTANISAVNFVLVLVCTEFDFSLKDFH